MLQRYEVRKGYIYVFDEMLVQVSMICKTGGGESVFLYDPPPPPGCRDCLAYLRSEPIPMQDFQQRANFVTIPRA